MSIIPTIKIGIRLIKLGISLIKLGISLIKLGISLIRFEISLIILIIKLSELLTVDELRSLALIRISFHNRKSNRKKRQMATKSHKIWS